MNGERKMTDFESHPIGTAKELKRLQRIVDDLDPKVFKKQAQEIERLRAELEEIAEQKTSDELDDPDGEEGDYCYGHFCMIQVARKALKEQP